MSNKSVFVIGDSISMHYGPYLEKMISGKYSYDRIDTNAGDSNNVLEYLLNEYNKGTIFDILLLNCGTHDIRVHRDTQKNQVDEYKYTENLNKICSTALKMSQKVIWIATAPVIDEIHNSRDEGCLRYNKDILHYNSIAKKIMEQNQIPYIDFYEFTKSLGENIYYDHVHFKDEVRELQGAFLCGYLFSLE